MTQQPFERPKERLWRSGPAGLNDAELLALLLDSGPEMGQRVLGEAGLSGLRQLDEQSVLRCSGLRKAKAARLLAAVELARRLARLRMLEGRLLEHPRRVVEYLCLRYSGGGQEVLGALYLDVHRRLVAEKELFRGTLCRLAVEPRVILQHALSCHARSIVLFHNHPSGDPSPSLEDLAFTRKLDEAARLFGLVLLDHLVVGSGGRFVSVRTPAMKEASR